jgi:hypothetical protein
VQRGFTDNTPPTRRSTTWGADGTRSVGTF